MASSSRTSDAAGRAEAARGPDLTPATTLGKRHVSKDGEEVYDPAIEQISKTMPTTGGFLEPESSEHAILRRRTDEDSSLSNGSAATVVSDNEPSENSPLLEPRKPSRSDAPSTPYLNGVSPGRFWFILTQILFLEFLVCFDGTIMSSSHPVITSYFHAANSASWLSTAFLLTSTAFQPLLGRLSDAIGRKPLFIWCIILFLGATVWCALANSIESFIAARAVCGIGGGGAMTLGVILISDLVPIERRGIFQGIMNVTIGAGAAAGAALGGAMAENLGWRWEFGVQVPFIIICAIIAVIAIPGDLGVKEENRKGILEALKDFDAKGSVLLTTAVTFFILGLTLGGNVYPWMHPLVLSSLIIAAIAFPTFFWVESWVEKPIVPLRLLGTSPRANMIFSNFIAAIIANGIIFNIPLYFQAVLLTSATSSGLYLVLPSVVSSAGGAMTGFAVTWSRRLKWPLSTGTLLAFFGCCLLCTLQRGWHEIIYLLILLPASIGQGMQFPGTFIAILAVSEQSEQAVITSTLILWRSLGMVLGVALSSLVVQNGLVYYLNKYVEGADKEQIIQLVRKSVDAIAKLPEETREQVVMGYDAALKMTFIGCAVLSFLAFLCIAPIKLPRLTPKPK